MLSLGTLSLLNNVGQHYIKQFSVEGLRICRVMPSGDIIFSGAVVGGGIQGGALFKYSMLNAQIVWSKKLSFSTTNTQTYTDFGSGSSDASGNSYLPYSVSGSSSSRGIVKYDANGNVLWQRAINIGGISLLSLSVGRNSVDSFGNSILSGNEFGDTGGPIIFKFDTNGTLQWQRALRSVGGTTEEFGRGSTAKAVVDFQNNVFFSGETAGPEAGQSRGILVKLDTNGNIIWQRGIFNADWANWTNYGLDTDATGNAYMTGYALVGSSWPAFIVKYDTSGTLQWQRALLPAGDTSFSYNSRLSAYDSDGNIYVAGESREFFSTSGYDFFIVKYAPNGTLLWQRSIGSAQDASAISISVSGNKIYLTGLEYGSALLPFLVVIPTNGSLTGIYSLGGVSINYRASNLSSITTSFVSATTSRIMTATSHTISTPNLIAENFTVSKTDSVNIQ
jgi:hypothetical protein